MKTLTLAISVVALGASLSAAPESKSYTGVISDSMCVRDHAAMKIDPDDKCVRECVEHDKNTRYVLLHDSHAMLLSDQATPAKFAGQRVTITGVYYPKTNILKVEHIEEAR